MLEKSSAFKVSHQVGLFKLKYRKIEGLLKFSLFYFLFCKYTNLDPNLLTNKITQLILVQYHNMGFSKTV